MAQPQRKAEFISKAEPAENVLFQAEAFSDAIKHPERWRASPARQMQEQLAAWAAETPHQTATVQSTDAELPAIQRLAIIAGASIFLWAGIGTTVVQFLPIW